jgi:hypothetical protein
VNTEVERHTRLGSLGLSRGGHGGLWGFHRKCVLYRVLKRQRFGLGGGSEEGEENGFSSWTCNRVYDSCELALGNGGGEIIAGHGERAAGPSAARMTECLVSMYDILLEIRFLTGAIYV